MNNPILLSDQELLVSLHALSDRSSDTEAELLVHLAEVDARKLYLDRAHPSLFAFCLAELNFSEAVTHNRIVVARASLIYPQIISFVRTGQVHLSGLRILVPHLTAENVDQMLAASVRKSKRQIEELIVQYFPKPAVPDTIRKLPAPAQQAESVVSPPAQTFVLEPPSQPSQVIAPLSAELFKVQFTATRALRDKIDEARELLRHQIPDGSLSEIIDRALTLLVEETKKRRFAVARRPRRSSKVATHDAEVTRHIPNPIKREVFERDRGRCTFVSTEGRRCTSRAFVEFDHRDGFARHREHSVDTIRLLCRAHNQRAADVLYGTLFMDQHRVPRRTRRTSADDL